MGSWYWKGQSNLNWGGLRVHSRKRKGMDLLRCKEGELHVAPLPYGGLCRPACKCTTQHVSMHHHFQTDRSGLFQSSINLSARHDRFIRRRKKGTATSPTLQGYEYGGVVTGFKAPKVKPNAITVISHSECIASKAVSSCAQKGRGSNGCQTVGDDRFHQVPIKKGKEVPHPGAAPPSP